PQRLATPSPVPGATGLLLAVPVWGTGGQIAHHYKSVQGHRATASPSCLWGSAGAPAGAFLPGWAPSPGVSSTWATSFLVPTWKAICLPSAPLSFPEYTRRDLFSCIDKISHQSHLSCTWPIDRPCVDVPISALFCETS